MKRYCSKCSHKFSETVVQGDDVIFLCSHCSHAENKRRQKVTKKVEYNPVPFKDLSKPYAQEVDENKVKEFTNQGWDLVIIDTVDCLFKREAYIVD
ncbi:hypothetical protein COF68_05370 [Bacillus toyonensis]|uniref:hypothetical protein n=1 Tax=Bacillus toyonensis TaxID=155322 RepID=UPI000BFD787B|nr:hypothetical protein [Bacillus toyonensis]PHE64273.1 hypothetical protein COF68_05370 [Bacillus toyonensis]